MASCLLHIFSNIRLQQTGTLRQFSLSKNVHKEQATNLKGHSKSSQEWLSRQLSDPYVEKAKMENYRCRSAFKLLEIDNRFHLLYNGQCVVDCGAAPGSWTQVCVQRTNASGRDKKKAVGKVIGIDRLPIYPIEGAELIGNLDFTTQAAKTKLTELLSGYQVNAVFSDMAPNATGIKEMDHENIIHLAYTAFRFAAEVSTTNASILLKVWDGREAPMLEEDLAKFYDKVRVVKPSSSRSDSTEKFLLGQGFKGLKKK